MGVTGLWRLVEPAGKPVPVETLENKVLAVDISIWLHQVVKGYQDAKGAPLPNAHLIGLFQRLCKLLYFRIKPIFVFDGGFPDLKKETIARRHDSKNKYNSESERLKRELAVLLSKKTALGSLLGKHISPTKKTNNAANANDDLFKLPALPQREQSESESSDDEDTSSGSIVDLHSVDLQSENFKNMPAKEKYDLLLELKETRKMNSWGKLHTLPKKSDNFSDFQMQRLLKRRKVQECIEETEKEMGDVGMSMEDLESLLNEEGIDTKIDSLPTRRIASNNNTRFLLISNVKEALAKAKEREETGNKPQTSTSMDSTESISANKESPGKRDELEDDIQRAIQMSLQCVDDPNTSAGQSKTDDSWTSVLTDTDYSEASDSEGELEQPDVSSAKAYIMQYSDYTHKAIEKIVAPRCKPGKAKSKAPGVDQVLQELDKEKSVIIDNVALSSDEEELESNIINSINKPTAESVKKVENITDEMDETIEPTQASVMFVENNEPDVISLDSSFEELTDKNEVMSRNKESKESISIETVDIGDELDDDLQRAIQMSLECVDNSDTSTCQSKGINIAVKESIDIKDSDSSNSDDEFEEVPELQVKPCKPVIELTLKVDDMPNEEDDIFADVFSPMANTNSIRESNTDDVADTKYVNIAPKKELDEDVKKNQYTTTIKQNTAQRKEAAPQCQSINLESNDHVFKAPVKVMSNELAPELGKQPSNTEPPKMEDNVSIKPTVKSVAESSNSEAATGNTQINKTNIEFLDSEKPTDTNKKPLEPLTDEKLNSMVEEIQNEEQDLIQEKGRLDRIGRNITEQMTKEAQELLQIFGIPYIVAPMEAEAQCAFLESVKLTDGTITDDSDIWLFGGQTVYKNFFNQKKHVLQYVSERIERSFNLTREQLILLALLVGSDYTTGVAGVGPVTAMEILASFPFNKKQVLAETSKQVRYAKLLDGLKEFKLWVRAGKRTDNTSLKKKLRNVTLSDDFPSMRVVQAYLEPNVEKSEDKFTWGEPDITELRDYAKSKFGWSQHKFDEIIKPVLARMKERKSQKTVHDYFKRKLEFQTLEDQMSKRVKAAVQKMGPGGPGVEENPIEGEKAKPVKKRRKVAKNITENEAGPSKPKQRKKVIEGIQSVKVVSEVKDGKSSIEIKIPKTERFQEIIPQREKDKQHLLENKMKAIELFRKTQIDRKRKPKKRRPNLPKDKADLSESSSSD